MPEQIKIALLLPAQASMRLLRRVGELAAVLAEVQTSTGEKVEIAIGLAEPDEDDWRHGERTILSRAPAAIVRHLAWTAVPVDNARRMFFDLDPALDLEGIAHVVVPRDWGWNFKDCAFWISLTDPSSGPILPLRPIVYYNLGLPERYVPQMVAGSIHDPYWTHQAEAFRMWRQAIVVTSDPTAIPDLVSYAGVRSERTDVIPDVIAGMPALAQVAETERDRQAVVWVLRGNAADDLEACLAGLTIYVREGGTLVVKVAEEVGVAAESNLRAAALPTDLARLNDGLDRIVYRSLDELDRILLRSGGLWSSQIAGGAGEHLLEAQRAGLHVLAPSFELNRQLVELRSLSASLYAPGDALGIADALKAFEKLVQNPVPTRLATEPNDSRISFASLLDWLIATTRDH